MPSLPPQSTPLTIWQKFLPTALPLDDFTSRLLGDMPVITKYLSLWLLGAQHLAA